MKKTQVILLMIFLTIMIIPPIFAEDRITNGGFENGTYGWTETGTGFHVLQSSCPGNNPENSNYGYYGLCRGDLIAGNWQGSSGTIDVYQDFDFTGVSIISFFSAAGDGLSNVKVDSTTLLANIDDPPSGSWTFHSLPVSYSGTHRLHFTIDETGGTGLRLDGITALGPVTSSPVANFSASPTSGTAPLSVQFTDTSTGSPISWTWDFGDGDNTNATIQNPLHTYTSAGSYTVELTASNAYGNDSKTIAGFVTVTGGTINYYVFSDGIRYYHNLDGNEDLYGADDTAQYFYQHMTSGSVSCNMDANGTNYCWNERSNPVNDDTGSIYWNSSESADSTGANSAEFAFHVGHGWEDGIVFGTENTIKNTSRSDMRFSRAKWIAFDSCLLLKDSNPDNWTSVFDGLHILMGFETVGKVNESIGPQFVERMKGGTYEATTYPVTRIREAWEETLQNTIGNSSFKGAYIYAEPSRDDFLAGYGPFEEPIETNGEYDIHWTHFDCS